MNWNYPARVQLAHLPTPIEKLPNLSKELGVELYIKRDDQTGSELSGNKIRKLEFVFAAARAEGCDTVITCGGIQSNHCRATAVAARKLGMRSYLILRGEPEGAPDGNLLIDHLVGAEIRFITPEMYKQREQVFAEVVEQLRARGQKPFVIPEGASDGIGLWGYISAMEEIKTQMESQDLRFDAIAAAVGSGGTYGGMLLGKKLHHMDAKVYGINICDTAEYFHERVIGQVDEFRTRTGLGVFLDRSDFHIIDGYVGEGYARNSAEDIEFIRHVAAEEGVIVDPVYTAKAFRGLVTEIKKGTIPEKRILFIHTGGVYGLFPKRELFR